MIRNVEQRLLTADEAAAYLKIGRSTFYARRDEFKLKSFRLPGMPARPVLYRVEDLDDLIWNLERGRGTCPANEVREQKQNAAKAQARAARASQRKQPCSTTPASTSNNTPTTTASTSTATP